MDTCDHCRPYYRRKNVGRERREQLLAPDDDAERKEEQLLAPLLAALGVIEASDVIFAVDSVPAVLSITQTTFVAYSAMAFAVLGLRALYFALEGLTDRFVYLHYGLAAILIFLWVEFVLQGSGSTCPSTPRWPLSPPS